MNQLFSVLTEGRGLLGIEKDCIFYLMLKVIKNKIKTYLYTNYLLLLDAVSSTDSVIRGATGRGITRKSWAP